MNLSDILVLEAVRAPLRATSKKALFRRLAELAASVHGLEAEPVYRALLRRETLGSTGVGRGVAIPHARLPELDHVNGLFVRLAEPVAFGATDRRPVDLVFTLLGPDAAATHLKALARIARTLRNEAVRRKLRSTFEPEALHAILTERELECTTAPPARYPLRHGRLAEARDETVGRSRIAGVRTGGRAPAAGAARPGLSHTLIFRQVR